jgi:hypothetical protein
MKTKTSERGQAMILIVIGFIIILGFVGLAIDGGQVYSDRRHAQNAADASALAASGRAAHYLEERSNQIQYVNWNCSNPIVANAANDGITAAINRASTNSFTIDGDADDFNGAEWVCREDVYGGFRDRYIDFTVWITTFTTPNFAQFLFNAPLESRVQAVARLRPRMNLAYGHAVVATNTAECSGNQNGVIIGGSSTTHITGGGIWSNGCLKGDGSSFNVLVDNGNVVYVEDLEGTMSGVTPSPVQVPSEMPDFALDISAPDCTHPDAHNLDSIVQTGSNDETELDPGLYCLTSSSVALKILGGTFIADGVTFYIPNGSVQISGGAEVHLQAPQGNNVAPAIAGMLIFMPPENDSTVDMQGNSDSTFLGTIYAPGGNIILTGANGTHPTFNTQLIGNNVDISGNVDIDIVFSQTNNVKKPTTIDLNR